MAETIYLRLKIGIDQRYDCTILNKAKTQAIDITTWALSWMVKRRVSDPDASALMTKTIGNGIVIVGIFNEAPAQNAQVARVSIADDDTVNLTPGLYVYELKRTDPGFETPLIDGNLHLEYTVHRA